ncbi:sulfite exporter TauE/SafE family protein [Ilumatobacter nonamiensis]|uniref:sulfite exporter TauE/SafE family protein n=1 Tax=Ilumatobacter nonamiensis TaxID=467093 RepID=UPI00034BBAE7|nr:sulfite exporter TauE/SafE family protein [Ilumatobacter nonamiensis]
MTGTELTIVLLAVIIGSIAKAVTGMGLPLIAIPIAALFVDLDDAVVTIAFPNILANGVLAWRERSHIAETRDLPTLATAGVIGAVVGAIAFVSLPEEPLVILLIVAIAIYVIIFFAHPDFRVGPARSRRLAPAIGGLAGAFQGAIGISGPIVGSWIHSYRLPRGAHIFAVTSLFLVSGTTQFVVLVFSGELSGRVGASLLACVPVLASIPIGSALRNRVSARGFDLAVVGMLVVSIGALAIQTVG